MSKERNQFLRGLLTYMAGGLVLGVFCSWFAGKNIALSFLMAGGFGLFYLHRRWIKKINRDGDVKIKSIGT